jgi:type I restriction enzyme S subunit
METKTLEKQRLKGIPKLRFKGFKDEWNNTNIASISTKITDGTHDAPPTVKEGIPYLTAIHVKDGFIDFNNCYYLTETVHIQIYKRCNPEKGDLLMVNIGAGTATSALIDVDFEFSLKNVALIKPDKIIINSNFFSQVQRKNGLRLKHQLSSGGAQPFLSLKQIGKLKLNIPSLPEQQKIASFLSALDKKIQQLTRKKELLEIYKKGVMQQLFSQEIRFKPAQSEAEGDEDGKEFPEWEEKKLGEIATFSKGKGISKDDILEDGLNPCIRYGQLYTTYKETIEHTISKTNVSKENLVLSKAGDVIIPASGETQIDIATASCVLKEGVALGGDLNIIRGDFNGVFIAYYLNSHLKNQIARLSQGSSVIHLYSKQLTKLKMSLPIAEEQQKITDFLSAIDKKIEAVSQQITKTQSFKKGLLQQMFV